MFYIQGISIENDNVKNLQGSSHRLKAVGGACDKRKNPQCM